MLNNLSGKSDQVQVYEDSSKPGIERSLYVAVRALSTSRGILGPGEDIYPSDFATGEKRLKDLLEAGYVRELNPV